MSAETPLRHTNEDDALVRALHAAYDDGPSEAELRALEAGVLGAIQGGGGGGGGAPPVLPKTSLWMPLASVVSVGALVAIAVGVRFMATEEPPETPSVSPPLEAPQVISTLETPPLPHGVEPPIEVTNEPSRGRRPRVEEPATVEEVPAASAPEVENEDETVLLRRATSSLQAHPGEALVLTERMARVPHPEWAEERERVAIEALVRLSRRSEAEARFARFSQAYPRSAYATRLRDVLSEAP
jgi:hypothetical protein